jgi:hypothetical protein
MATVADTKRGKPGGVLQRRREYDVGQPACRTRAPAAIQHKGVYQLCTTFVDTQRGILQMWYLGNEMSFQLRYRAYPNVTASEPPPSPAEYAAMLGALVPALLAVDPSLQVTRLHIW